MTCWAGLRALWISAPTQRSRTRSWKPADHPEVDIGLEQGHADLAQDLVDVVLAEASLAAQTAEDALETVGECVEHRWCASVL